MKPILLGNLTYIHKVGHLPKSKYYKNADKWNDNTMLKCPIMISDEGGWGQCKSWIWGEDNSIWESDNWAETQTVIPGKLMNKNYFNIQSSINISGLLLSLFWSMAFLKNVF